MNNYACQMLTEAKDKLYGIPQGLAMTERRLSIECWVATGKDKIRDVHFHKYSKENISKTL